MEVFTYRRRGLAGSYHAALVLPRDLSPPQFLGLSISASFPGDLAKILLLERHRVTGAFESSNLNLASVLGSAPRSSFMLGFFNLAALHQGQTRPQKRRRELSDSVHDRECFQGPHRKTRSAETTHSYLQTVLLLSVLNQPSNNYEALGRKLVTWGPRGFTPVVTGRPLPACVGSSLALPCFVGGLPDSPLDMLHVFPCHRVYVNTEVSGRGAPFTALTFGLFSFAEL